MPATARAQSSAPRRSAVTISASGRAIFSGFLWTARRRRAPFLAKARARLVPKNPVAPAIRTFLPAKSIRQPDHVAQGITIRPSNSTHCTRQTYCFGKPHGLPLCRMPPGGPLTMPLAAPDMAAQRAAPVVVGLVQINNSFSGQNYLPYSIALLQTYVQQKSATPERFQ